MPRSSLMTRLWAAAGATPITRRQLLQTAGAALAGAASSKAARPLSNPRIGIVGAGIAGLTAALTLQDAGLPCTIYESSGRIGGRMHTNKTWAQGQISEWCGELIDSSHHLTRKLAARFGIPLVDVNAADPAGSVVTNYFLGSYYTDAELASDMQTITPILAQQNKAIGKFALYDRHTKACVHFDHLSAWEWIETYVPGGHSSRLGQYLDVAVNTENGLDTRVQSSLNLIFPLNSNERFHMQPGNEALPRAIYRSLPAGSVNKAWRLTAVTANSDQTVTLSFVTPAGLQQATFDYVILTLPFSVLRKVDYSAAQFDQLKQTAIQEMAYGTNSKLVLQFDDRYWNGTGQWPRTGNGFIETDLPFQTTWETSRGQSGPDGLLTNFTGGSHGASFHAERPYTTSRTSKRTAAHAETFVKNLNMVWPGVSTHYGGLASLSYPTGDPNLLGSYSTYAIGQYTTFAGYERVPQGNIYFAGEHTSYNFQGYMEGGIQSGVRAANDILELL